MKDKHLYGIQGLDEVEKALASMPAALQADILRRINRDVLNRIVRPRFKDLPWNRKKFRIVNVRREKTAVILGVDSRNYWLRFTDQGTEMRQNRKGHNRGTIAGLNLIKPRLEDSVDGVIKEVQDNYGELAAKHLNRKITQVNKRIMKLNTR